MREVGAPWSAWNVVIGFGTVSLAVDLVADGARSVAGPLLGQLGATALVVGLVTGTAEALGFVLRLVSGPAVDRTKRYWGFTIGGYALTGLSVPLLAFTPFLGAVGLTAAATLIIVERVGKAIRSPAKTVLLAYAAGAVGRGRGFAVHKVLDQVGAFLGPLLVAAIIALTGVIWPAFAVLAIPALVALWLLLWMRHRIPDPSVYEPSVSEPIVQEPPAQATPSDSGARLPATSPRGGLSLTFLLFSVSTGLTTFGLVGFGVISFHLTDSRLLPVAAVPLVFAAGMAAAAVAALGTGRIYDRIGAAVLISVPVLAAGVPALSLSASLPGMVIGVVLWGAATGIQDSTVKALVADLVSAPRRGTAYGVFAVVQGTGTFAGAALAGGLYPDVGLLSLITVPAQIAAVVLLTVVARGQRRASTEP
jgi:MFS family permease